MERFFIESFHIRFLFVCVFFFHYYLSLIVCTWECLEKKSITPGTFWGLLLPWENVTRSKNTRVLITNSAQVRPKQAREFAPSFPLQSYHETRNLKVCGRGSGCNLSLSWHNERASTHQGHLEPQWVPRASHSVIQVKSNRWGFVGKVSFLPLHVRTHTHTHKEWSNESHADARLYESLTLMQSLQSPTVMICTWNHTLTYNKKASYSPLILVCR